MALVRAWTVRQASGPGLIAGAVAVLFWPLFTIFQGVVLYPFVAALALYYLFSPLAA